MPRVNAETLLINRQIPNNRPATVKTRNRQNNRKRQRFGSSPLGHHKLRSLVVSGVVDEVCLILNQQLFIRAPADRIDPSL